MKSDRLEVKAEIPQQAADINNMKDFYNGLHEVYGARHGATQLTSVDGKTVIQDKSEILDRFTDHLN